MVFALSCRFSNLVSIVHFKGNAYLYIHLFEPYTLFVKSMHACPFCFSIGKGLATCRLGGVISAQKVIFLALFEIGFECFFRNNHINLSN